MTLGPKLDQSNFEVKAYRFRDRQAGVSLVYDPDNESYTYNAYCLETLLVKDIYSREFGYLEDALDHVNDEFGTWDLTDLISSKKGCDSCVAKH